MLLRLDGSLTASNLNKIIQNVCFIQVSSQTKLLNVYVCACLIDDCLNEVFTVVMFLKLVSAQGFVS